MIYTSLCKINKDFSFLLYSALKKTKHFAQYPSRKVKRMAQYSHGNTSVLRREYWSTFTEVLKKEHRVLLKGCFL